MGGASLRIGDIDIIIDKRLRPTIQTRNVGVFDQNGTEIAVLDQATARLAPGQFLRGAASSMRSLNISGAIITVRRDPQGNFDLVFGQGAGATGDLANVLDSLDQSFSQDPLAALGKITADHVTISLEDARSGRLWQVTDGRVALIHSEDSLDLRVEADVFNGTEDLATTVIGFQTEKGSARATLTATFENARASDIAAQSPVLSFLDVLDAPISGALRTTIDEDGKVEDLAGTLTVQQGALQPNPDAPPILFEYGQAYLDYDPENQAIQFSQVAFESETASVSASGSALFRDFRGRWPQSLIGQFDVSHFRMQPEGFFAEPMEFDEGIFEFRLKLDPFAVDIGQLALGPKDQRLLGNGRVRVSDDGWSLGLDLNLNKMPRDRILQLWPVQLARGARDWVTRSVIAGEITELNAAVRLTPAEKPKVSLSFQFGDATVKALKFLPPIDQASGYASLDAQSFTAVVETGRMTAPKGGKIDIAGSYFKIADITASVERGIVKLFTESTVTAALSLLNLKPLEVMDDAGVPADVAEGRARVQATLGFDLIDDLLIKDVDWRANGQLYGVTSKKLIKDRNLTAKVLEFRADPKSVEISGTAKVDGLPMTGTWAQTIGPGSNGNSRVTGDLELSQAFLTAFNIDLPPGSLSGSGVGQLVLDLAKGVAPKFSLKSDLNRIALSIKSLGWSKPRNRTGKLEIAGRLGDVPSIDRLRLSAPGLDVSGVVDLTPKGGLQRAQFDRVRVGNWLDGPVTLTGRGSRPPAIAINGGTLDLRSAELGGSSGGEPGGPLTTRLSRLTISEGIFLTDFRGDFKPGVGLEGQFTALVNGLAPINGSVLPTPSGPAIRIISDSAGRVLAAADIITTSRGGSLDMSLNPARTSGVYNGRLKIKNTRLYKAPAITEMINAISIVGLLDQLNSGGILLADVDAEFQLSPEALKLLYASATGPSIGVSLDGIYNMKTARLDMQGVLSPVYFLNGLGQIFSRGRDGLFGFSFRMTGNAADPNVSVNPLSILTPGAFREIFRKPPPQRSQ